MSSLASQIEAILYLKAQPLPIPKIAEYARSDRDAVEAGLIELMASYAERDSALEVVETSEGYCLQLRESFHSLVQTLIPVDLGVGALRTLAAIALTGSMSQTDLIELRGSGAYDHVKELVELGFVRKKRQTEGRSYWLQVSDKFYQYFQVDKLPQPSKLPVGNSPQSQSLQPDEAQMELEIMESSDEVLDESGDALDEN
ncbi:MAG: SMC-Scp complex subunit ScpB [Timaviella obliquedivisa GSE-PSE-MK23-08B]|jgi:segregation and condensation protein B|nr:SMC-Scp complex subunit ScpB [Timaviella obliquedivisa GSE-PSE-MK23-08B]